MNNGNGEAAKQWGRKFWLVVGIYFTNLGSLIVSAFSQYKILNESTYLTITLSVIGGYLLANVAQKVMGGQPQ